MLIKDLPEEIRVLALKNQVAQGNLENLEADLNKGSDCGGFWWDESSEGFEYWSDINKGNFGRVFDLISYFEYLKDKMEESEEQYVFKYNGVLYITKFENGNWSSPKEIKKIS